MNFQTILIISAPIFALFLTQIVYATNYCEICKSENKTHVGCNNNGQLQSTCPAGASIIPVTADLQTLILGEHNKYRQAIANGSVSPFLSAVRMATTLWDDELAKVASFNANSCKFGHDACRKTDAFPWSGQNIASSGTTATNIDIPTVVTKMIASWYSEFKDASMANIDKYSSPAGKVIGHFTATVNQKQTRLGCALVRYFDGKFNTIYFVCNYSFTNVNGYPVYVSGPACSKCTTGCNPLYPALCNPNEPIEALPK